MPRERDAPHTDLSHRGILVSIRIPHKQSKRWNNDKVDNRIDDAYVTDLEMNFLLCAKIARDCGYRRPNLSLLKVPKKNTI